MKFSHRIAAAAAASVIATTGLLAAPAANAAPVDGASYSAQLNSAVTKFFKSARGKTLTVTGGLINSDGTKSSPEYTVNPDGSLIAKDALFGGTVKCTAGTKNCWHTIPSSVGGDGKWHALPAGAIKVNRTATQKIAGDPMITQYPTATFAVDGNVFTAKNADAAGTYDATTTIVPKKSITVREVSASQYNGNFDKTSTYRISAKPVKVKAPAKSELGAPSMTGVTMVLNTNFAG